MKPARLRPGARADLADRSRHYEHVGGGDLGLRFFDSAMDALDDIEEMPGMGSPTVGELTGHEGLRRMRIEGFPCGWLSVERDDVIEVIRLLADRQDLGSV